MRKTLTMEIPVLPVREINDRLAAVLGRARSPQTDAEIEDALDELPAEMNMPVPGSGKCAQQMYFINGTWYTTGVGFVVRILMWQKREGMVWQQAIESYIRDYRIEPPNYAGDLETAHKLRDEFETRYADYRLLFVLQLKGVIGMREPVYVDEFRLTFANARDIAMAALLVLENFPQ